ncbi:molecular chaperone HscC [Pseudomonas petrae]|uniref:Molecular chaperone HscC n=1 Tax=Pseudomonas petrae TaxID=2912190 RepID=A0ABS9I7E6_9PSED|nr:molecular chaperone HscC [Pseudomonas petrae]MCF7533046.1 molecular chaperone HscC [Pseudomonas petrae]MCF7535598.1 molecular chaperone HscC [Pseudomonas petrae]MCF7543124.1 molecular chaperone HscC [Pseudomonas petrae]MCF7554662.1 molecular chaperone HscC [Pseudomonas petrae]
MIVGIDLGTTNSLVAVWKDDASVLVPNALGELLTPSVVGLDDEGRILVGQAARERLHTHPSLTTALFKRHMGSAHQTALGNHVFRPEELSALVLRSLKEDVERAYGETVVEAVISVPAYFSDAQRKATRIAGELAGLKVDKLINEPTAAALAFGLPQHGKECSFLVFDLGGGTFDVSILELFEGVMEVRASAGDNFLGGEDFDRLLAEAFVRSQADQPGFPAPESIAHALHREAQRLRIALGQVRSDEFVLRVDGQQWQQTFTQADMAALYAPLLERLRNPVERAMRDAKLQIGDLDEILMVGGTTRMPLVRKLAAGLFGRFPSIQLNPDEAVAHGAAIQAALKSRDAALEEVVLTDVCSYTLGIEVSQQHGQHRENGHYLPIIERNTTVPVSRVKTVCSAEEGQAAVKVCIFQGESRLVRDNIPLGELEIPLPPHNKGNVDLDVRFTYDNNGILECQVTIPKTGEQFALVIENNPGVLSPKEIAERLQALAVLKVHPRDQQVNTLLMARLEHLYQESLGERRELIGDWASQFQRALDSQDERIIRQTRTELNERLGQLERGGWH